MAAARINSSDGASSSIPSKSSNVYPSSCSKQLLMSLQLSRSNSRSKTQEVTTLPEYSKFLKLLKTEYKPLICGLVGMVLSSTSNLLAPKLVGKAIDISVGKPPPFGLTEREFILGAFGLFSIGACGSFVRVYSFAIATQNIASKLRKRLYSSIIHQDLEFYHTHRAGELTSRLTQDVQVAALSIVDVFVNTMRSLNSALGGSIMIFFISPKLTLIALSTLPIIGATVSFHFKKTAYLTKNYQDSIAYLSGTAEEIITNIITVRLFTQEESEEQRFNQQSDKVKQLACKAKKANGVFMGGMSFTGSASLFSILYLGGSFLKKGEMTVGSLTSFVLYCTFMGLGFAGLASSYGDFQKALNSTQAIFKILASAPIVENQQQIEDEGHQESIFNTVEGRIEFENVNFSYPSRPQLQILNNFNLVIEPGSVIAIFGSSGCGKSTVTNILTRLYDPLSGKITLDGVDISTLDPKWLRKQIGIVNQEPSLFSGSIRDNIKYGKKDATKKEIIHAAREANIHDYILTLPEGYDTYIGKKGMQLSGGQKQRIAIARAILLDPKIMILDEATSCLDQENRNFVQKAIDNAMKGRTCIVISHAKETLEKISELAVLHEGKIVEKGTYEELYKQKKIFYQLMTLDEELDEQIV